MVLEALRAPMSQLIAVIVLLAVLGAIFAAVNGSRRDSREISARMQMQRENATIHERQLKIIENQQLVVETAQKNFIAESSAWRKAVEQFGMQIAQHAAATRELTAASERMQKQASDDMAHVASAITAMTGAVEMIQRQIALDFEQQRHHFAEIQDAMGINAGHVVGIVATVGALRVGIEKIMTTLSTMGVSLSNDGIARLERLEKLLDRLVIMVEVTNHRIQYQEGEGNNHVTPPFLADVTGHRAAAADSGADASTGNASAAGG